MLARLTSGQVSRENDGERRILRRMALENSEVREDLCLVSISQGRLADRHSSFDIGIVYEDSGHGCYSGAS